MGKASWNGRFLVRLLQGASEIYADIWEKYLKPCVRLIEAGEQEECRELYTKMVRSLEKKYLYSVGGEKNE